MDYWPREMLYSRYLREVWFEVMPAGKQWTQFSEANAIEQV